MPADQRELADLEHENLIAAHAGIAENVPGGIVVRQDGLASLLTGMPARLFNQILVQRDDVTPKALVDAVRFAQSRHAPWVLNLREGADDRVAEMAEGIGLVRATPESWMPGLALANAAASVKAAPPLPAGLEIVRAVDAGVVHDHARVAAEAFEMPQDAILTVLGTDAWLQDGVALYTGYLDGTPVVAGLGVRSGPTIGVYNIATVGSARRRGYGEAMTRRVVADGVADGATVAILQSSDMGRAVYERIGFQLVVEYAGWVEPTG